MKNESKKTLLYQVMSLSIKKMQGEDWNQEKENELAGILAELEMSLEEATQEASKLY